MNYIVYLTRGQFCPRQRLDEKYSSLEPSPSIYSSPDRVCLGLLNPFYKNGRIWFEGEFSSYFTSTLGFLH